MKTKAVILEKLNTPLIIDEIEIPELECGQVLVDIYKSGICGAQISEINGTKGEDKFLPHLLGHEGAGVVLEVGKGVTHVKQGDKVVAHWRKGQGIQAPFPKYKWGNKTVGGGNITTFCEKALISENRLTVIEDSIPFEYGALMGCAMTTALGLINNEAQLKIGQSIMILGCGGVGLNIIQGARMVSANPIIAVDKYHTKLFSSLNFGATDIIDSKLTDFEEEIKQRFGAIDIVVDTTGNPEIIEKGWAVTGEKMILVGQPHWDASFCFKTARNHFYNGKQIFDSQGGLTNPNVDIPRYLKLYLDDRLNFEGIISHEFKLEDINKAIEIVKSGESRRCILNTNE